MSGSTEANSTQYGLNSVPIIAEVGGVYLNFGLWGLALVPAWLVIREIGTTPGDQKVDRERTEGHRDTFS